MINALVLVGGKSSRFGSDKYEVNYHGKEQYIYLVELLESMGLITYISCTALQGEKIPDNFKKIVDLYPEQGPLGGILSSFNKIKDTAWLVIACDMPLINEENIQSLLHGRDQHHQVVTFQTDNRFYEATFAIYETSSYSILKDAFDGGERKIQKILKAISVKAIPVKEDNLLININTRLDYERFLNFK